MRGIQQRAVEEPVRQGRIVPGVVPEPRLAREPVEVCRDVPGRRRGRGEPRGVPAAVGREAVEAEVRKVPRDHERDDRLGARFERERPADRAGEPGAERPRLGIAKPARAGKTPGGIASSGSAATARTPAPFSSRARASVPKSCSSSGRREGRDGRSLKTMASTPMFPHSPVARSTMCRRAVLPTQGRTSNEAGSIRLLSFPVAERTTLSPTSRSRQVCPLWLPPPIKKRIWSRR